jgi:acyl-CoA synthetase (AMP-forming)/AMP-acid ligase II
MNVIDFFDRGAERCPDQVAFEEAGLALTYAHAAGLTHRLALALSARGLGAGDIIATCAPNSVWAYVCILAIQRVGAVWLPLNAKNPPADIAQSLRDTESAFLFLHSDYQHLTEDFAACLRPGAGVEAVVGMDPAFSATINLEKFIAEVEGQFPALPENSTRIVALFGTGGTTGKPKYAQWTNQTWEALAANQLTQMPQQGRPVCLVAAPMIHAAGIISFPLMLHGVHIVLIDRAEPLAVMQAIERHRVTHLFLPPTVIYRILAHPEARQFNCQSLQYFWYAAAPMSVDKLREAIDLFGPVMAQSYGQVEAPMICTYFSPEEHVFAIESGQTQRLSSCGRPSPFVSLKIIDDDGIEMPLGQRGEIAVRGSLVMRGYLATGPSIDANGWHRTGDIGQRDADGFVYIVDRKHDMIISGGFNIYPGEIEQHLWAHPAIQDCAVIGTPDEVWGERVTAVIELKDGAVASEDELIDYCKVRMGSVKAPKAIEIWPELPRSPVGKVLKRKIREKFWQGHQRKI